MVSKQGKEKFVSRVACMYHRLSAHGERVVKWRIDDPPKNLSTQWQWFLRLWQRPPTPPTVSEGQGCRAVAAGLVAAQAAVQENQQSDPCWDGSCG